MLFSIADPFIRRPVLTTVCSIIIVLVGAIAIPILPISQLPQIAPTQVEVTSSYIGADAQTAENTVTTIIEREINGVEDMRYMSSNTSNDGVTNIQVSFPVDVDRNIAQVNVQNRVAIAEPQLPAEVRQTGVSTRLSSPNILLGIAFFAENGEYDDLFLSNYLDLYVLDLIQRIPGVGRLTVFGERKYAMRLWLDPNKLAQRQLTAQDVVDALEEQNLQVGAGKIGQQPAPAGQEFEITLRAQGRFETAAEFEELVLKVGENGNLVQLRDVGRVELGAENYDSSATFNGLPTVGLGISQLPGSNALNVAAAVKAEVAELAENFPPGMQYEIAFDSTLFIDASLREVVWTLVQAIGLVILVIYIFLQDWRTTLIPAVAIPVSLIGTMAFILAFGFEINTLTLFGCVLATGLVVDDGIVVVEEIATKIENGMRPRVAALEAMNELSGAVVSTSLVLMAVFVPVAFFPGTTGVIYRQFALTIAFAIVLSTFNALTFSPSMSALLLRRQGEKTGPLGWFFNKFNQVFGWISDRYRSFICFLTRIKWLVLAAFAASLVGTVFVYQAVPSGFVTEEDQGYFFTIAISPDGVSLNYTNEVLEKVAREFEQIPEIQSYFGIGGFGFDGNGSNKGFFFTRLKDWEERPNYSQSVYSILGRLNQAYAENIPDALIFSVNAPPVPGLSNFGGFEMQLQDRRGNPISALVANAQNMMVEASQHPALQGVFTQFTANTPQIEISIDRNRAKALDIDIDEIFTTLQTYLGSTYVNDFVLGQRQYRVYAQAEGEFRSKPEDLRALYVRSGDGNMVSLGNLVELTTFTGPQTIPHYNLFRSIKLQGNPAPGYSSGQAIAAMEEVAARTLDPGFGYEWTGTALEELSSGGQAPIIFILGLVMVFLVLSAQYESYIDPIIILLTVPLAILGALSAIWLRTNVVGLVIPGQNVVNDVYCQIGLVMLIGLASKNAILIVEFANQSREDGMGISQAAIYAAQQRFRPILMTAISSLIGFFPLVTASGAGSASRWSLGTAVFGGMLVATVLSLLVVPVLYIIIKSLADRYLSGNAPPPSSPPTRADDRPTVTPKTPESALPASASPMQSELDGSGGSSAIGEAK